MDVFKAYFKAVFYLILNILLSYALGTILIRYYTGEGLRPIVKPLTIIGTGLLLVAATGRLGWSIQTWNGTSKKEKADRLIFIVLSQIGVFTLFLGIFLAI